MSGQKMSPIQVKDAPQTLYRGLYVRVAKKLGVDPSYVSRVARGHRRSPDIEDSLREEMDGINEKLGVISGRASGKPRRGGNRRVAQLVRSNRSKIPQSWLRHSLAHHGLRRIKVSPRDRLAPVAPLVNELLKCTNMSLKEVAATDMKAASGHGRARKRQGFTAMEALEEYNLIRRCVMQLTAQHSLQLDTRFLIRDLGHLGEVIDLQMQSALGSFLKD